VPPAKTIALNISQRHIGLTAGVDICPWILRWGVPQV
jgi:hypothetical protein